MKLYWTKEALLRLQEIENFISQHNPEAAAEFIDKIIQTAETIRENPEIGRIVPELSIKKIRELIFQNYRIVYYLRETTIEILTVFEGHQLLKKDEVQKNTGTGTFEK